MTNPSRVAFTVFGRDIYWYGILIAAAVLAGIFIAIRSAKRHGWKEDDVVDFALWAVPGAVICARLYYVIFEWEMFRDDPIQILKIWEGGLAIYGAVIGGIVTAVIFCRARKLSFWDLADIAAPSLVLGQAIGRWGNFFNQEAFGIEVTNPRLMWFPMAVRIDATNTIHYATFFYESMWCLLIFIFLMAMRRRFKHKGDVFLWYAMLYAFERMFVEGLRTDSLYIGSIRVSQALSALLFAVIAAFMIVRALRERKAGVFIGAPAVEWKSLKAVRAEENAAKAGETAETAAPAEVRAPNEPAQEPAEETDGKANREAEAARAPAEAMREESKDAPDAADEQPGQQGATQSEEKDGR